MRFQLRKDPMALVERGNELARQGDWDGATAAYQRALDSGHPEAVAEAGVKLGIIHRRSGAPAQAVAAYRAVMATGHADRAPFAAFLLAGVLTDERRFDEAVTAYEFVIGTGHHLRPDALACLAEVQRFDLRDTTAAAVSYERAIGTGDPKAAPRAMLGLADLLSESDPGRAADLYQRVADSGHVEAAPIARRTLRQLRGEPEGNPGTREAAGVDECRCLLVLDGDGEVRGLWFEDPAVGDAYAADRDRVKGILVANNLTMLMPAGYRATGDHRTGGYRITFER